MLEGSKIEIKSKNGRLIVSPRGGEDD